MSKRAFISRYLLILKKLQATPYCSFEEIEAHLSSHFQRMQVMDETIELAFSKRTFQRDCKEIHNLFGLQIEYSPKYKGYFINKTQAENKHFQRMMEEFEILNSLSIANDAAPYIHLENRKPQGTENLYGLLHAIKNRYRIQFTYQKFWDEEDISNRVVAPYALKEFKNRWYVLAKDQKDNRIKTFALDRLTNLEITNQHFEYPKDFHIEETYRYCFGIISPKNEEPQNIILSFDPIQGKFIKTLPLHDSQEILVDNEEETKIQLNLCITHDLLMELLSFGDDMKVIAPQSLAEQVKTAHEKAFKQYGKNNA